MIVHALLDREAASLATLPPDDPIVCAERRRLVDAMDQVRRSARLLGLDPATLAGPFRVRCDAWLWRVTERGG
jgi:hypothetical protein